MKNKINKNRQKKTQNSFISYLLFTWFSRLTEKRLIIFHNKTKTNMIKLTDWKPKHKQNQQNNTERKSIKLLI